VAIQLTKHISRMLLCTAVSCGGAERTRLPPPLPTATARSDAPPAAVGLPPVSTRQLEQDTELTTASGATFEAPQGWFYTAGDAFLALENPERDVTLRLVEVPNEADGVRAIQAAWKRVEPGFGRLVRQRTRPPPRDGWDAVTQVVYETGASEQRTVVALARRKGTTQYVALIDGTNAGIDRRGAQLMTVTSTFRAPGVEEESFAGLTAHPLDAERLELLEQFIIDAMASAEVPGAAVLVVQGDKIVFEKGLGVRELGKRNAVTPNTLFMIGSATKSLTTLMMAKLIDEARFSWETPANQLLPSFALADPEITRKLQLKHTVCACAGLPRQDMEFLFEYAHVTPEQRVEAMRSMRPTTGFGETFQYSNTMVAAGGYIAAHALEPKLPLGPAYERAMQTRVFGPLRMTSTTFDFGVVKRREHAVPHAMDITSKYRVLPLESEAGVVSVLPAGAAWSNLRDMSKYVLFELRAGRSQAGNQLISRENLFERRTPQIKITDKMSYGLGLFVEQDHGVSLVHHGGNTIGFTSDMFLMPEQGVGVVLLTNAGDANAFRKAVRRRVIELLFDGKAEATRALGFALASRRVAVRKVVAQLVEPEPEWVKGLAGRYSNANLGPISIELVGSQGIIDAGEWKSAFGKKQEADGTAQLILLDPPLAGLELLPALHSGRRTLTLETGQQAYGFELEQAAKVNVTSAR